MVKRLIWTWTLLGAITATAQAPMPEYGFWSASSSAAKQITGDVAMSSSRMSLNFYTTTIAQIRELKPEEVGAVFDSELGTMLPGRLYRLQIPASKVFLHKNTLCGSDDVQWAAVYSDGRHLDLALFSGKEMPVFTTEAVGSSSSLCGVFTYTRQS